MSEGLFEVTTDQFAAGFELRRLLGALVKVRPLRTLEYDVFETVAEAEAWSAWLTHDDGTETIRRGFAREELAQCDDPEFSNRLFIHEFCEMLVEGQEFPASRPITGHANGVCVGSDGTVLTAYHLVSGAVKAVGRQGQRHVGEPTGCPGVEVEVAVDWNDGGPVYERATSVQLLSNPSTEEAYGDGLDVAVLRVTPAPLSHVDMVGSDPAPGSALHLIGWGMRTARPAARRRALGYEDVNYDLRVSHGAVLGDDSDHVTLTDLDAAPGHSGSPVVTDDGRLAGIYIGSTGNGIVHWENAKRRHTKISAIEGWLSQSSSR